MIGFVYGFFLEGDVVWSMVGVVVIEFLYQVGVVVDCWVCVVGGGEWCVVEECLVLQ